MDFTVTQPYSHPADEVFAVLTDFVCVRDKYEALGQSDVELVSRDECDDGGLTLVTRRVVPLELPGFAKRVLSPRQTVVQTDTWTAPDTKGGGTTRSSSPARARRSRCGEPCSSTPTARASAPTSPR